MFSSLKIGRLFGIDVFVHPTFWLLPLFVFLSSSASLGADHAVLDVAVLFAVFGCVALHEFGHALAAMHYGIRTRTSPCTRSAASPGWRTCQSGRGRRSSWRWPARRSTSPSPPGSPG